MEGRSTTGGRIPFALRLDDWAFAIVELKLSTTEFNELTECQWDALVKRWSDRRAWDNASRLSASLSARWGTARNPLPFPASKFLPETPEAREQRERLETAQRIYSQRMLNDYFKAMATSFKPKPEDA